MINFYVNDGKKMTSLDTIQEIRKAYGVSLSVAAAADTSIRTNGTRYDYAYAYSLHQIYEAVKIGMSPRQTKTFSRPGSILTRKTARFWFLITPWGTELLIHRQMDSLIFRWTGRKS